MLELILEDRLGVVQEPPDQGRLAVVDRARGGDPQELTSGPHVLVVVVGELAVERGIGAQKYPSRLRSSIAASVTRSSARVSPRSVMRVAAISETTSGRVVAVERTAPVQVMSPTVR